MKRWSLITGASEGLGREFAHLAVKDGHNVVITARSTEKLEGLAEELRQKGGDVVVISGDLSDFDDVQRVWAEATNGRQLNVLVNNAGLGSHGDFVESGTWPRELASMRVNMIALTWLMKQAIDHMKSDEGGKILNVASVAGFMPGPHMAVYHATKAFVLSLSEAVAEELKGSNVTVTALCPGATATSFFDSADMHAVRLLKMGAPMRADVVAEQGWRDARMGKRVVIPGVMNKFFAFLTRIMPRRVVTMVANSIMGKG